MPRPVFPACGPGGAVSATRATLERAISAHQAGRIGEAASGYEAVLAAEPRNPDALHLLGVAMAQGGRARDAARLIGASLEARPEQPDALVNLGQALLALGRPAEALAAHERAIDLHAPLPAAHRGRAAALAALGRHEDAIGSLGELLRLTPNDATAHAELGRALASAGRPYEALEALARALALNPSLAEAHHHAALIAASQGDHAVALAGFDRATVLQPRHAALQYARAGSLRALNRTAEALAACELALALEPHEPDVLHLHGLLLADLGRCADAVQVFDRALALRPAFPPTLIAKAQALLASDRLPEALRNVDAAVAFAPESSAAHLERGRVLARLGRFEPALASFDEALAREWGSAAAHGARGISLAALGRPSEALESFVRALLIDPDDADVRVHAAMALRRLQRPAEAAISLERALSASPAHPLANWQRSMHDLALGQFAAGWRRFEARLQLPTFAGALRGSPSPRWTGEPLAGKTVLVQAERGLHDTLQFCRYVPLLHARGARVILEAPSQLHRLLATLPGVERLIERETSLPVHDFHSPLLSLPLAFGTDGTNIPADVPYLAAESERVREWGTRLAASVGPLVGIAWRGQDEPMDGAERSFRLADAAPLATVEDVRFVSLQKGEGTAEIADVAFRARIDDFDALLEGGASAFADTAALIMQLDLIVTADTAIAHLAGALGAPVWVVLSATPDWRWLTEGETSAWYPGMRLIRRGPDEAWGALFGRVAEALASWRVARCAALVREGLLR
jgi:tetratricopeptide (TPR) repeat protein